MENTKKFLADHRAVVTGASSGIGAEYARQLAQLGASLVLVARRLDRLETLAAELRAKYGVGVSTISLDLSTPGAAKTLFDRATAGGKEITLLVNNAGIGRYGSFMDFSVSEHLSTIQINSSAPTEATYLFVQHMLKHGKPSYITQIASIAAFHPAAYFSVYCGSKGYLLYFTQALAFELKDTNIKLTCVCPGGTYTEFFEQSGQKITAHGHRTMMSAQDVVRSSIRATLRGKVIYIPGVLNKIACFMSRLLPRGLAVKLAFITMNKAVERVPPSTAAKL